MTRSRPLPSPAITEEQMPSSFLSLPLELRLMIYDWLFSGIKVCPLAPNRPPWNLAIIRTSKQIRTEASPLLCKMAQFVINAALYHPDYSSPLLELYPITHSINHLSLTLTHADEHWDWAEAGFEVVSRYFTNLRSILLDLFQPGHLHDSLLTLESDESSLQIGMDKLEFHGLQDLVGLFVKLPSLTHLLLPSEISYCDVNVYHQFPMALPILRDILQRIIDDKCAGKPQRTICVETYPHKRPLNPSRPSS